MRKLVLSTLALFSATAALCAPPEHTDPAYAPFFKSLHLDQDGKRWNGYCCNIADCRVVRSRHLYGYWEAYIDKETYGPASNAPDDWVRVPNGVDAISDLPNPKRPDEAIACWYQGSIRCFDKPTVRM